MQGCLKQVSLSSSSTKTVIPTPDSKKTWGIVMPLLPSMRRKCFRTRQSTLKFNGVKLQWAGRTLLPDLGVSCFDSCVWWQFEFLGAPTFAFQPVGKRQSLCLRAGSSRSSMVWRMESSRKMRFYSLNECYEIIRAKGLSLRTCSIWKWWRYHLSFCSCLIWFNYHKKLQCPKLVIVLSCLEWPYPNNYLIG